MDFEQQRQKSSLEQKQIDDYLSRFKTIDIAVPGTGVASDNALEQYLLERAVDELQAARARLAKLTLPE